MNWIAWLSLGSNIAQIITGSAAGIIGGNFIYRRYHRRHALEQHLSGERDRDGRAGGTGTGSRSVMHLVAHLAMTEEQILEAAFTSTKVKRWTAQDPERVVQALCFFNTTNAAGQTATARNRAVSLARNAAGEEP